MSGVVAVSVDGVLMLESSAVSSHQRTAAGPACCQTLAPDREYRSLGRDPMAVSLSLVREQGSREPIDASRLRRLAGRMPHAARAFRSESHTGPGVCRTWEAVAQSDPLSPSRKRRGASLTSVTTPFEVRQAPRASRRQFLPCVRAAAAAASAVAIACAESRRTGAGRLRTSFPSALRIRDRSPRR